MDSVEKVLNELYDKLLLLKYPGVAKAARNDMDEIVLGRESRVFLLSWLLAKTPYVNREEFLNKPDESTVVQWYSEMGISNDPEVLMGRVPIQDQIPTLKNLMLFIDSALLVDQLYNHDQVDVLDVYKKCSENLNIVLSTSQLTQKLSYNGALQVLEQCRDRLNKKNVYDEKSHETENNSLVKEEKTIVITDHDCQLEPKIDLPDSKVKSETNTDLEERISNFVKSFENVSSWPKCENSGSNTIPSKRMGHCIENLYTNLKTLKEIFQSKDQIANSATIEPLKRQDMTLDSTIENIVIAIEEHRRLQTNDHL